MRKVVFAILMFLSLSTFTMAQGEAAVPFLNLPTSPQSFGTGWSGVSRVTNSPTDYYFNPAILGSTAKINHFSVYFWPVQTDWLNSSWGIKLNSFGINTGYNLSNTLGVPLSIGIGYIRTKFEFGNAGNSIIPNDTPPYDKYDALSLGLNLDYWLSLSMGLTYKSFISVITGSTPIERTSTESSAIDLGVLIEAKSEKILQETEFWNFGENNFRPTFDLGLGYSISNIGKEIYYVDEKQKDPIGRIMRFGYSISAGADLKVDDKLIEAFSYTFNGEASDVLIKRDTIPGIEYLGAFGDLRINKNLIMLESDNEVSVHRGHTFNFLETFYLLSGRLNGPGWQNRKTDGFGISTSGIFKYLSTITENTFWKSIFDHSVIEYFSATVNTGTIVESTVGGLSIRLTNITF
jgi:hypothetical protein